MQYVINLHSIVNIITNSSSEIFVVANESSISTIKELINSLIKVSNNTCHITADDLFEFSLVKDIPWKEYYEDESEEIEDLPYNIKIMVKAKNTKLKNSAETLSNLTDLFKIYEAYN